MKKFFALALVSASLIAGMVSCGSTLRVFIGQEESSTAAVIPWLSLIKDFLAKTNHGMA